MMTGILILQITHQQQMSGRMGTYFPQRKCFRNRKNAKEPNSKEQRTESNKLPMSKNYVIKIKHTLCLKLRYEKYQTRTPDQNISFETLSLTF